MRYKKERRENFIFISFSGRMLIDDIDRFYKLIKPVIDSGDSLVIDLRKTSHIHYRIINHMLIIRNELKRDNRDIKIICRDPYIISIFSLMQYPVYEDLTPDMYSAKHSICNKALIG